MTLPRYLTPILVAFAIGALLTAASCASRSGNAETAEASSAPAQANVVPVVKVIRSDLVNNLVVTGEFIPYQEIDLMAKEAGYIRAIHVDIGDRVHTGQVLAELEIPEMQDDIARAAAGVQAASAAISTARGDLERAQSTYRIADLSYQRILDVSKREPGLVPQQEVDVANSKQLETAAQVSAAQSDLETSQRKLAMAKAEEARWNTLQKYTIISAPFTGVITKRYANTGSMIQQGTASETQAMPVVRLSQNNLLRLILPVPESAVPSVRIGETVDVTVASLHKRFPGRITRFEDKVALSTRTMNTEVDVPNANYQLVPGMYAEVNLRLRRGQKVLSVPLDAIEETDNAAHVYRVQNSTIQLVDVATGIKTASQQEIVGGLQEGDLVIVGRHAGLENGQNVKPQLVHFDDAPTHSQGT